MAALTVTATPSGGGDDTVSALVASYLGASFAVFLGLLPHSSVTYIASLQSRNRILALKLFEADDQIKQMKSRRREDSKANARVAEIFAGQRNTWQQEERRLHVLLERAESENDGLRARIAELEQCEGELRADVEQLQQEVADRDEMLDFMSQRAVDGSEEVGGYGGKVREEDERDLDEGDDYGGNFSETGRAVGQKGVDPEVEVCFLDRTGNVGEVAVLYEQGNSYGRGFSPPANQPWTDRSSGWKDVQYDSLETMYHTKHLVARRESPWKVVGESTGVSSKLKLLEQELINLEKVVKGDLSRVPSLMKKQAKRYQALAEKIDDLCRRMQVSDPFEPTLRADFRTQRQTEFLVEAFRLQSRATETRQKLAQLQAETAACFLGDSQANLSTKRSLDSMRNNFKEIQRNLEIWLARIMGDLEGTLARDGTSSVRDYYITRYPFIK